jgi:hypothetical protein
VLDIAKLVKEVLKSSARIDFQEDVEQERNRNIFCDHAELKKTFPDIEVRDLSAGISFYASHIKER